ncbi:MAG TPA: alpha/beta hydrolase, partial [Mariniphaga sp.]|nr:alpha/beta hydrolase [Mariniphaga sp.]
LGSPRTISFLFPERLPIGYYYDEIALMAVGLGFEQLADLKPDVPASITAYKDLEYKNINGKSLQLDIYKSADSTEPLPLLVFIHGGSWKGGKRSDYLVYILKFAGMGYATATVSYRLLSDGLYPAAIEDVCDAVKWLADQGKQFGYDPTKIALIGGSAGAHLAMLAGYGWSGSGNDMPPEFNLVGRHHIKAVVNIYGPADLTTEYARNQLLVENFLGHSFNENPEVYKKASPVIWLNPDSPPTLIFHGTSDRLVPVSQSDFLKEKLDSLDVANEYYRLPFWPHVMDVSQRVNDFMVERMNEFFKKYL